jgi:peptidase M42 family hydrolase
MTADHDPLRLEIDVAYLRDALERLLAIPSPTGFTDTAVRHVCAELEALGVDYDITRRGAIRARLPGAGTAGARAIVSHIDTLGAQVRFLKENGRAALAPIGTWSARFAEGARATVFTESGAWRGTILPLKASGHTFNDEIDSQPIGWDHVELRIDAMAFSRAELQRLGVEVGDIVAIDPQPEFTDTGFIVSRHLDNKAGVAGDAGGAEGADRRQGAPAGGRALAVHHRGGGGARRGVHRAARHRLAGGGGQWHDAPGQNSSEFGVTIAMADQTGPFDYHLSRKLAHLCAENDIRHQKDVFRHYRSDSASAVEAGADVRTALVTFGVDASHGYERIHMHALRSLAELLTAYVRSDVEIPRDAEAFGGLKGFTEQPTEPRRARPARDRAAPLSAAAGPAA